MCSKKQVVKNILLSAHSSMDRVSACGAEDTSSIPVGRTI